MSDFVNLKFDLLEAMAELGIVEQRGHGGDAQVERLLAVEEALLAVPDNSIPGVLLKACIHLRRMTVAADEDDVWPLGSITDALDRSGAWMEEARAAILGLVTIAEQHHAAILAGNCDRDASGTPLHSTLDSDRAEEVQHIDALICQGRKLLLSQSPVPIFSHH